jgi:hypothetical protein
MITESDREFLCNLVNSVAVEKINGLYNLAYNFESREVADLWGDQHILGMVRGITNFTELINAHIRNVEQKEES